MKIEEYYDSGSADRNDSLMVVVRNYRAEQKHLAELKSQTSRFLVPVAIDGGFVVGFDASRMDDVKRLSSDIVATSDKQEGLLRLINRIDKVLEKYGIERPTLREIQTDLVMRRRFLDEDQEVVAGTLSQLLLELRDERAAHKHPDYAKALQRAKDGRKRHEPAIKRLEAALKELEAILLDAN